MKLLAKHGPVELSPEALRGLAVKWPGVNVEDQLALMALWLERHEKRRPVSIWRFIDAWLRKVAPKKPVLEPIERAWWTTPEKTLAYGKHVGVEPRRGEEMNNYRERLFAVYRAKRSA